MGEAAKRPATYADIEAAPAHLIAEIIGGRLTTRHYFGPRDGFALTKLHRALAGPHCDERSAAAPDVMLRPEVHIAGHVLVPELGMWRRGEVWDFEDWREFKARPSWVLEWITPWTDLENHAERCRIYAQAGIPELWRVDSVSMTLQTYSLDASTGWQLQRCYGPDHRVLAEPFPHIEINWAEIWEDFRSSALASANPVT